MPTWRIHGLNMGVQNVLQKHDGLCRQTPKLRLDLELQGIGPNPSPLDITCIHRVWDTMLTRNPIKPKMLLRIYVRNQKQVPGANRYQDQGNL